MKPKQIPEKTDEEVQEAGLMSKSGIAIPLKAVHVRAQLLDMVGKVVVLQHYHNNSRTPIEAKYVCPLDEMAGKFSFGILVF